MTYCSGITCNPSETVLISPYNTSENSFLGLWSLSTSQYIGSKPIVSFYDKDIHNLNDTTFLEAQSNDVLPHIELCDTISPAFNIAKTDIMKQDKEQKYHNNTNESRYI